MLQRTIRVHLNRRCPKKMFPTLLFLTFNDFFHDFTRRFFRGNMETYTIQDASKNFMTCCLCF